MKKTDIAPFRVSASNLADRNLSAAVASLLAAVLLVSACGAPEAPSPGIDTLASDAWPTEAMASASGKTRGALRASWQAPVSFA